MRTPSYQNVMVIVHGKSEHAICKNIQSNLRISQKIIARDKGGTSIQITSIMSILNDSRFKSFNSFKREFPNICYEKRKIKDFRLFIIMDTDDCTEEQKMEFIEGKMFNKHWLSPYIIPIYNSPNLEKTMTEARIEVKKKADYIEIFPTNHGDADLDEVKRLYEKIKKCRSSNMAQYLEYCIELAERKLK